MLFWARGKLSTAGFAGPWVGSSCWLEAPGQMHPQVNPADGPGVLPGARLPQGFLGSLVGIHLLTFLPR